MEWRDIPGFPLYEITLEGDVRNKRTLKHLNETQNAKTGAWSYSLWIETKGKTGRSTSRSYETLVDLAFPEWKVVEWKDIPGYPNYVINKHGEVRKKKRNTREAYAMKHWPDQIPGGVAVRLRSEAGKHLQYVSVQNILNQVWPGQKLEEAA